MKISPTPQSTEQQEILSKLQSSAFGDRTFEITDPSIITIQPGETWTETAIEPLGMIAGGKTADEAIEDYMENVSSTWEVLVNSDVNTLSQCALPVREALQRQIQVQTAWSFSSRQLRSALKARFKAETTTVALIKVSAIR